jgi:hypothetical protein
MTLSVISIDIDSKMNKGIVKIATDEKDTVRAYEELKGMDARNLAITTAATKGMPDPRVNDSVSVIAVDEAGQPIADPKTQKLAGFHGTIPVIRKMV